MSSFAFCVFKPFVRILQERKNVIATLSFKYIFCSNRNRCFEPLQTSLLSSASASAWDMPTIHTTTSSTMSRVCECSVRCSSLLHVLFSMRFTWHLVFWRKSLRSAPVGLVLGGVLYVEKYQQTFQQSAVDLKQISCIIAATSQRSASLYCISASYKNLAKCMFATEE